MFQGRYAKWLLPGVLFQSTLIGGGYASGREIVEFGGRFGALGLWSILVIFLGFALLCALAFEFCRVTRSYDYGNFIRGLLGPLWWAFDLLFIVMAVLVIAIVSAATGEVAQDTVGVPYLPAVTVVIVAVGALILGGGGSIEKFKTFGTVLLYGAFIFFAVVVLLDNWDGVQATLAQGESEGTFGEALFSGGQYVSYNLVILPAVFFALYRQTSRKETLTSGFVAGLLASIPFVLTFLCIMAFFPDEAVLGAEVPWLAMLADVGGTALVAFYAFIVIWTLVETATGLVHAIMDRINAGLSAADRTTLSSAQAAGITVVVLIAAVALAQIGIIELIAQGYGMMAYGFFALFALPLLTVGVYRIVQAPAETPAVEREQVSAGL
jgi:uncharacterized membrane protein YkvI